jgi:hypothetical protein
MKNLRSTRSLIASLAAAPIMMAAKRGLESCATNSPTTSGVPSSRCCRTSRAAFHGGTTVACSTASSESCDLGHRGATYRMHSVLTLLATTARSLGRAGVWGRIMNALAITHEAAAPHRSSMLGARAPQYLRGLRIHRLAAGEGSVGAHRWVRSCGQPQQAQRKPHRLCFAAGYLFAASLSGARDTTPLARICSRVDYVNGLQEQPEGQQAASEGSPRGIQSLGGGMSRGT